jgi:hypothetical protein
MDVLSDKNVTRLVATEGTTRVYEMDDGNWVTAQGGTVSWRNNNPGNLKFGYADSADHTVNTTRSKEAALASAQSSYSGVVDLDQWGNAVFENYDAGRNAQRDLLTGPRFKDKTVEELVKSYSTADYSGSTHHDNQVKVVYATASAMGYDLKGKTVAKMTPDEVGALTDGLAKAEYWKAGTVNQSPPLTDEQLRTALAARAHPVAPAHAHDVNPNVHRQGDHGAAVGQLQSDLASLGITARDGSQIHPDQRFGPHTREAVEAFQQAHGLRADGIAGPATLSAISEARSHVQTSVQALVPSMLDARHPAHGIYEQAYSCVAKLDESQGRAPGPHAQAFAGSLTSAATAAGFSRVDHVALSDDANRGFAIQGDLNSPFKRYVEVDVVQAIQTPLAQSSQEAASNMQSNAQQVQAQQQSQQVAPEVVQQVGPAMTR